MQFRILIALLIFLGSYLPLSLILLAQNFDYASLSKPFCCAFWTGTCSLPFKNPAFAIGIFAVCVACLVVTLGSLAVVRPKHEILVKDAKYVPTDLMNYTLPYIVAFMSIDYQESGKFVGFLIFLGWMFWITYKSGQIILNPLLIVLGWRLYDLSYSFVGSNDPQNAKALVKGNIEAGQRCRQTSVQDILVIKNNGGAGG
ncbi:MAG: hypothetical protein GEV13_32415 [Rhodospirillales bacterium]|nr:hypothetical protein [Rhodospirillales bacterium]